MEENKYLDFQNVFESDSGKVLVNHLKENIVESINSLLRAEDHNEMIRLQQNTISNLNLYRELVNAERNAKDYDDFTATLNEVDL